MPTERALTRHIKHTLRLTFVGLVVERFVQAFLWFGVLAVSTLAAAMFGAFAFASAWVLIVLMVCLGVSFGICAKRFQMPTMRDARARVDETLPHHPLQALEDLAATGHGNAQTQGIWQAHQTRMAEQAWTARAIGPHVRLSTRDPYALRLMAITVLIMGLLFGTGSLRFGEGSLAKDIALGPSWEGWIEPPAHTGKPTLYLADMPERFTAPQNSKVTIRLYGDADDLEMRQTVSGESDQATSVAQDFTLEQTGEIEIKGDTGRLWNVALLPDQPPVAELIGDMTRAPSGELRQSFRMSDDFGIARAQLEIELDKNAIVAQYGYRVDPEPRQSVLLSIPVPRALQRQDFEGVVAENLSRHAFSGLPVHVRLKVWDVSGHEAVSGQNETILPGRKFFDPLAAALVDVRRELLWSRMNASRSAQIIRAVSYAQDASFDGDRALFSNLRSVAELIETEGRDMSAEAWDTVAETLWTIAVDLEDGELSQALERLRRAQERLTQAMRDGATPDEIAKLMQDLRDATQDYIRQRAEQQSKEQDQDQGEAQDGESFDVTADQLQELMDRIQELMEQGRMAEAQQLMEMLNEMLENMQVTQGQGPGAQAIEGLEDMLREQQDLNDETFSDLQEQFGSGEDPTEQSPSDDSAGALADRQKTLRGQAQQQGRDLPPEASQQGDGAASELERAERSMEDAEEALRNEDYAGALDNQARAMEALRNGLKRLNEQLRQSGDPQDAQSGQSQSGQSGGRDPLGRRDGDNQGAGVGSEGAGAPDQDDVYKQAEELLDEIRRRSAQKERADEELEYLKRLLDRF
ncbi:MULTISPECIES: DUF4175 domain-containing protein [Pacificibacter]|uniref:DUF4175 domain-containing protein n=1 Tax=Pacificibacter TaxID=1042323 RepID=UPI001C08BE56|nr:MULTISPECIES: DUF4175 family protein [Pacificibacter]MBU2937875.1 DUF4175 domain-containing protein [Pacificibacter marinus]MDO6617243.1 DUF4175 family protein [Pacificibacter sp. 1_MG-2023]